MDILSGLEDNKEYQELVKKYTKRMLIVERNVPFYKRFKVMFEVGRLLQIQSEINEFKLNYAIDQINTAEGK